MLSKIHIIIMITIESQDNSWYVLAVKRGEKKTGLIGVRLEPELMAAVEKAAEEEDRPLAMMARILIREAITSRKKKGEKKREGKH